jgi:hypothetical protein
VAVAIALTRLTAVTAGVLRARDPVVTARRDDLRHLDRRVDDGRDDEDRDAHRGDGAQPAQLHPALGLRAEAVPGHPKLLPDPVSGRPPVESFGQPQRQPGPGDLEPGHRQQPRPAQAGLNALETVLAGLDLVSRGVQRVPQCRLVVEYRAAHASRSSTVRSVAIARAVWLFTAPLLICIASAICASDMSA